MGAGEGGYLDAADRGWDEWPAAAPAGPSPLASRHPRRARGWRLTSIDRPQSEMKSPNGKRAMMGNEEGKSQQHNKILLILKPVEAVLKPS